MPFYSDPEENARYTWENCILNPETGYYDRVRKNQVIPGQHKFYYSDEDMGWHPVEPEKPSGPRWFGKKDA